MATATQKRDSPDDLLRISSKPMPELVNGRLVRRPLTGQQSAAIGMKLAGRLLTYSETIHPGMVLGSEGSFQIFPDDPNKVRIPDVSFTRLERLPDQKPVAGHGKIRPDLVAEIVSPNDRAEKLHLKIRDYVAAEIPLILVVYPLAREVEMISGVGPVIFLKEGDTIDGGDILPGFSCPVSVLFDGI